MVRLESIPANPPPVLSPYFILQTGILLRTELLTPKLLPHPQTHTHTNPPERGTQVQWGRGLRIERLGDLFVSHNDGFTRGLDIRYHTLGHDARMTPKRVGGGIIRRLRLRLI